jgi:hypothetical protein
MTEIQNPKPFAGLLPGYLKSPIRLPSPWRDSVGKEGLTQRRYDATREKKIDEDCLKKAWRRGPAAGGRD